MVCGASVAVPASTAAAHVVDRCLPAGARRREGLSTSDARCAGGCADLSWHREVEWEEGHGTGLVELAARPARCAAVTTSTVATFVLPSRSPIEFDLSIFSYKIQSYRMYIEWMSMSH